MPDEVGPEERRRRARVNLARASLGFANLMLWPLCSEMLRPPLAALGYPGFSTAKYVGATLGIIAAAAWLYSFRVGAVVQLTLIGCTAAFVLMS